MENKLNPMCEKCIWLNTKCEGEKKMFYTGCICRCTDPKNSKGKEPYWTREDDE